MPDTVSIDMDVLRNRLGTQQLEAILLHSQIVALQAQLAAAQAKDAPVEAAVAAPDAPKSE